MQFGGDDRGDDGDQRVGDGHRDPVVEQYQYPAGRQPDTATTHDEPHEGRDERMRSARLRTRRGGHEGPP